ISPSSEPSSLRDAGHPMKDASFVGEVKSIQNGRVVVSGLTAASIGSLIRIYPRSSAALASLPSFHSSSPLQLSKPSFFPFVSSVPSPRLLSGHELSSSELLDDLKVRNSKDEQEGIGAIVLSVFK